MELKEITVKAMIRVTEALKDTEFELQKIEVQPVYDDSGRQAVDFRITEKK